MNLYAFSVYDEAAAAYLNPFFFAETGQAIRAITDCVNDPEHQFGLHPKDYTLFQLGRFDNKTGTITFNKKPLGNCLEYKNQPQHDITNSFGGEKIIAGLSKKMEDSKS